MNVPSELSDEALVLSIRQGQHELAGELVRRHSPRLFLLIARLVRSRTLAEDVLQDTWIRVIRSLRRYDVRRPFYPWLTRIAVNRCRDHWRRERIRSLLPWRRADADDDLVEQVADLGSGSEPETPVAVQKALLRLSPKLRETVVMKFYSGMTHDEIAEALGAPPGTIKRRLQLALTTLRAEFDGREVQI